MSLRQLNPGRLRGHTGVWAALLLCLCVAAALLPSVTGAAPAAAATCPCTVFQPTDVPEVVADPDTSAVELGMKFRSDVDGFVTGVRFYKASSNGGTHEGRLWATDGTLLATATFADETASGWQEVSFSSPVAVDAQQTYVVSYYAPAGRYSTTTGQFASAGIDSAPLHALRDGEDGPNGVYRYGAGGGFPANTWQSANYWVDAVFETSAVDATAPTLTGRSPAPAAADVPPSAVVSATFSEAVQGATLTVVPDGGSPLAGATSYDSGTRTATFAPAEPLALSTSHAVTVSGAADPAGNEMTPDSWEFTTAATESVSYTIWPDSATPQTTSVADSNQVELGVKFRAASDGYVTGIRFYKGPQNVGTHVGTLWTAAGQALASVTFTAETGSGWQTAQLAAPVPVVAGTTYVASYHTTTGFYSATSDGFAAGDVARGPLTALQSGVDGGNGVYAYGGGGFPTSTYRATNYFVDVVFAVTAADTVAPTVTGRVPSENANGTSTSTPVSATFSEPVTGSSVQMQLADGSGTVPTTYAYDATTTTATLTPTDPLQPGRTYEVSVSGATDPAGNTMAGTTTWSFSTADAAATPPTEGPGGPVLVLTNAASAQSAFAPFTAEILRAEGLNAFATADVSDLTAGLLAEHDVVILGRTPVTAAQVLMLEEWVADGGNLIAFRPATALGSLLGLGGPAAPVSQRYIKVDTTAAPGEGITDETLQTHGEADRWSLGDARPVATLYSDATTATPDPAVTVRSVGTNGGQAAAFAYDLPQSIAYTRQGNPEWEGQNRDSSPLIRSNDLYYGDTVADWVDLDKVAVPQADEQQRLLANLIEHVNQDRKPLPRFAYFPDNAPAVVVATGDDHAQGGTSGRFDQYLANSPAGCSVLDWGCLRFSSYVFPNTALTDGQARSYSDQGFEVGLHPQNGCSNFTPSELTATYTNGLADFGTRFPSVPSPTTSRYHCIVWSDWASQAKVSLDHGIRLDTNYYYFPGDWVADRPGFMTGSGMPMRFVDTDGSMLDVYQAATQMTDESGQSYPFTPDALLDAAVGPLGYYGAFTANMHTDEPTIFQNDQLLESARERGVPVVSSRQLLTWLDGRNASAFRDLTWTSGTLSFDVAVGQGGVGLTALLPVAGPDGTTLSGLTRDGSAAAFTTTVVKGVEYAQFDALPGAYDAGYEAPPATTTSSSRQAGPGPATATTSLLGAATVLGVAEPTTTFAVATSERTTARSDPDAEAPTLSDVDVYSLPDGTTSITWTTQVPSDSTVQYGRDAASLTQRAFSAERTREHTMVLTDLDPAATYHFRITSVGPGGRRGVHPATTGTPATFVTSGHGVADRSAAQFRMQRGGARSYLRQDRLGEVTLAPGEGQEFDLPELPGGWDAQAETGRGVTEVTGGRMSLDGRRAARRGTSPRGDAMEFSATFSGSGTQLAGWAAGTPQAPFAMFELRDGRVHASLNSQQDRTVPLSTDLTGSPHDYRIEWTRTGATFSVDGRQVAALSGRLPAMRPQFRDLVGDGVPLEVDWVRSGDYANQGSFESRVLDAGEQVGWDRAAWRADVPDGTSLRVSVRTGSTPSPDGSWSGWTALNASGARVMGESRYLQYRIAMTTTSPRRTPALHGIGFTNNGTPREDIGEAG